MIKEPDWSKVYTSQNVRSFFKIDLQSALNDAITLSTTQIYDAKGCKELGLHLYHVGLWMEQEAAK